MRAGLSTERVVALAAELADEAGAESVTVSRLARHCGVRPASLYAHLDGAADLHARLTALALDELADRAAADLAGRSGTDALAALAGSYRAYAREHPGRYAAARRRLDPDVASAELAIRAGRRHTELTRATLRGYDLPEPAQTHAVRLLGSLVHGFTDLEATGAFEHSEPAGEESWQALLVALDAILRRGL
ncbi:MAG: TetR-like C-terminal domain-containing protein [Nocardioides sp.]|uniref:TetR-like C-terminal domain-containing protein n=1 Tax=Nocardioides sp. TaxID=35761 RepID=UPI0039E673E1